MAIVRERGSKWQARVRVLGQASIEKTFTNKADAEAWAKVTEADIIRGLYIKRLEDHLTLSDLIDRYADEVSAAKRGKAAECYRLAMFRALKLAKLPASRITSTMIATWRDQRIKEVAPGTVLRELQLLAHIFSVAKRDWGLHLPCGNPVEGIRKPAPGKSRDRVLNSEERAKLLAECLKCKSPWIAPSVEFALETGACRGEILSLLWGDVNLLKATARVDGKTGARTIPLSSRVVAMLSGLPRSTSGFVFPVTVETLKQAYERAIIRAGISDFNFHDLRHDALTRLAGLGLNILELRAISGHTTANMLQRYVRIDPSELARKLA